MKELLKKLNTYGMDSRRYSKYFKAFGDPSRQKILVYLSSGVKTVQQIADNVGLSQPTVSRHLAILKEADAVSDRRDGQRVFYQLRRDAIRMCCISFCDCLCTKKPAAPKKSPKKEKKK